MVLRTGPFLLLFVADVAFCQDGNSENWQFELTPYLWLPTISADVNHAPPPDNGGDGGGAGIDAGPTDWLDLLNGAFLINGGMRKGRFSLNADFVYLGLESENDEIVAEHEGDRFPVDASVNLDTKTTFDGTSWTIAAGYTLHETPRGTVELLGGARYLELDIETSWNLSLDITAPGGDVVLPAQGGRGNDVELWDGILGVRGHYRIGDGNWAIPYYLDVGTGSSDLTWQALAGISYGYRWGELILVYRHLDYNDESGKLLEQLALSGPTFGARFRF